MTTVSLVNVHKYACKVNVFSLLFISLLCTHMDTLGSAQGFLPNYLRGDS